MALSLLTLAAAFTLCAEGPRTNCVVDGDTLWVNGEKVRLADINAPETDQAGCPAERALGEQAKRRLLVLVNAGPFALEAEGRATDRYGRALRVARRGGRSLGEQLVREGLAEPWRGRRSDWCVLLAAR
ncbi:MULTISPECIES: thermonuclease family protein [unclassified Novosphingobium]|uniref:thermonuclease family protein n=1 Tax=unclassified Novosphingobium TaxID=2644732 RepID=UPI000EBD6203|nr:MULTISPECIES: thermonuclease family protein [unclassified Novosphingobium]HCF25442.1 nuclease [Novosphingobium sp.]HQV04546.1 thermonuclease family protein [Novosphingobium sp.]